MTLNINRIIEKVKNPMVIALLFTAFLISLYVRAVLPHDSVFLGNGIFSISEDDGVYQMRIVDWIIHNYPHFLWFDPYTLYPSGQSQAWAPLFTFSLATIIWIIGLGSPSLDTTYTIGAYFPAILGALVIIPTYFVAKNVFEDRRVGILCAFVIALLPGHFLDRSVLGFVDHHIAETLLSTFTMLFLILSVKAARRNKFTFNDIKTWNWKALSPSLPYFVLTGVFMSLYALTWKGALLFAFIFGVYILIQHIIDHMHNERTDYLGVLGFIIFLIPLLTVILMPQLGGTKDYYYMGLIVGIIAFPLLSVLSYYIRNRGYEKYYYPISIVTIAVIGLFFIGIVSPYIFDTIINSLTFFSRSGGGLTIAEAFPYSFTFENFKNSFGINGVLAFIGLAFLVYGVFKKERHEKTVFLVWTVMMLWALFQQNRFVYYYAVNVAVLSAYFGIAVADKILESGDWNELLGKKSVAKADIHRKKDNKKASKTNISEPHDLNGFDIKKIKVTHIISLLAALFLVAYLVYPLIEPATMRGKYGTPIQTYWYESLTWMRYNTPDPGIDYYGKYQEPPPGVNYSYPDSAYGVMSWWDYGHMITAWAHRIPNANPFQSGIGGGSTHAPGASTFLSAQSEEEANAVLDALGVNGKPGARYVITDDKINFAVFTAVLDWADIPYPYEGYYTQVRTNKGSQVVPYTKRYNAMMMRLHLFDGDGLKTYRLVHESVPAPTGDGIVGGMGEAGFKDVYNKLFGGNLPVEYTGHVKIFEHVKGAHITGKAPVNATVSISLKVKTNQGREYSYSQKTVSNGEFELIVPYSTEGPISGETNFDTEPIGKYILATGNISREVSVNERMVIDGGTEKFDLV